MDLGPDLTSTLAVVALVLAVLALVLAVRVRLRLLVSQARYRALWVDGEKDLIAVFSHQSGQIAELQAELDLIREQITLTPEQQRALAAARAGEVAR